MDLREKVTIGIPVYNEARFIRETLDSAVIQGATVVVSDNASTDGTSEICREYADKGLIQYIRHSENQGAWRNFKFLAENAVAPYFIWLGGHDLLEKEYIAKAFACLDNDPQSVLCYSAIRKFINANGQHRRTYSDVTFMEPYRSDNPYKRILKIFQWRVFWLVNSLLRTEVLRRVLDLVPDPIISVDVVVMVGMAALGKFNYLPEAGYIMRSFREPETIQEMNLRQIKMIFASGEAKKATEIYSDFIETMLKEANLVSSNVFLKKIFLLYAKYVLHKRWSIMKESICVQ